jgi:predicted nucleotidyltransferase component of viral defense system
MKDRIKAVVEKSNPQIRLGILREFLQCVLLRNLHAHHHFNRIAFVGGTALRLIYDLHRFSEDLDFSLTGKEDLDFEEMLRDAKRAFGAEGVDVEVKAKDQKTVHVGWFSFPRLLYEMGISSDPRRKLSIKLDVDTNPPPGAHTEQHLINRHFPFALVAYDLPSLFAGKLHAVLTRAYTKGRDYYDLVWYLTRHKNVAPNIELLNAALDQTGWQGPRITPSTWKSEVQKHIEHADWKAIVRDVSPFLEDERDLEAMKFEYVIPLFST